MTRTRKPEKAETNGDETRQDETLYYINTASTLFWNWGCKLNSVLKESLKSEEQPAKPYRI